MGNRYKIFCVDCKKYFDLDSELAWWQNEEQMYCLKDFLLAHTNHNLKVGGDEWNRAWDYNMDEGRQLPLEDYDENEDKYSKEDFKELKEREEKNK